MSAVTLEIISQMHSKLLHLSPQFSFLKGCEVSALTFQVYDTALNFPSEVILHARTTISGYSDNCALG